jgi:pilus assembly protein CpaE
VPPTAPHGQERRELGSASIELIGVLPFLLLAILVAGQLAIAGHTIWSAGIAARAGARAALVGGGAERAARAALPPPLRDGARVGRRDGVSVEVRVPRLLPGLPEFGVTAATRLGEGR